MLKRHSVIASNKSLSAALVIAFRIGCLRFANTLKTSQFFFTRRDILKWTCIPENCAFILYVGIHNACLSGRFQIGVVFHRDMSASGRWINKCMVLLWPCDRLVEKIGCCSGILFGKVNHLTSIADIFGQNEITSIGRNGSMLFEPKGCVNCMEYMVQMRIKDLRNIIYTTF